MNAVYLSGWVSSPIVVVSGENSDFHVKTTIKIPHLNAAKMKKYEVFMLSVWRETAKRFMEQARIGSGIMLRGYLSTQINQETTVTEVTVTEFHISNKESLNKKNPAAQQEKHAINDEGMEENQEELDIPVLSDQ